MFHQLVPPAQWAHDADVNYRQNGDGQGDDQRQRGTGAGSLKGKGFLINEDRQSSGGVGRAASGHDPDDVENLESLNRAQHNRYHQWADQIGLWSHSGSDERHWPRPR